MNESRHPIDDLFREGLESQHFEAPTHVWERIDQKRTPLYKLANNFRQNYRFYLSVVAGLALLSSFALWLLVDGKHGNQVAQADPAAIVMHEDAAPANPNPSADATTFPSRSETADKPALSTPNTQANPTQRSNRPSAAGAEEQHTPTVNPNTSETPVEQPAASKTVEPVKKTETPKEVQPAKETQPNPEEATENPGNNNQEKSETSPRAVAPIPTEGPVTEYQKPEENKEPAVEQTEAEPVKPTEKVKAQQPPLKLYKSLELVGSYDFVSRSILNADPAYLNARRDAESIGSAFTFQARFGYEVKKGLTLKTGLSFSRIHESIKFQDPYTVQEIKDRQETGYIVDPINGPRLITYTVRDTQDVTRYREVQAPNSYTFIDIPLMVQYDFLTGKRWSLGATGGMLINLKFDQLGTTLHRNAQDVVNMSTDQNPFKARAGVDLMLNLSAAYHINRNWDIILEPAARFGTGSLMKSSFGIGQRYNSYSLYTGLRYRF